MPDQAKRVVRPFLSADELDCIVSKLAESITRDFRGKVSCEDPLLLVGVLKGAVVFLSDLARAVRLPVAFDFIAVSSYGASTSSSGIVRILKDLDESIEGRRVIIVEDIIDTGLTLRYLQNHLQERKPEELRICALLDKPDRRKVDVEVDYIGKEVPNKFLVGYGLDLNENYRSLPYLGIIGEKQQPKGG